MQNTCISGTSDPTQGIFHLATENFALDNVVYVSQHPWLCHQHTERHIYTMEVSPVGRNSPLIEKLPCPVAMGRGITLYIFNA